MSKVSFVMHVTVGPMRIKAGTRIGQYLSFNAEALHRYDGSYGHGKDHDQKYATELKGDWLLPSSAELTQGAKFPVHIIEKAPQTQPQNNDQPQKKRPGRPKKEAK